MNNVSYTDVNHIFSNIWCNSREELFWEIAWDCLTKEGLTTYTNDKTYAQIFIYAYVIQMMCDEFSYMAYDEYCSYNYETDDEEPLTYAAVGWLYRDAVCDSDDIDDLFSSDPDDLLLGLMNIYRRKVSETIFNQLGELLVGNLLYFSIRGCPLAEDIDECDLDVEDIPDEYIADFSDKEELLLYCRTHNYDISDFISGVNSLKVSHWLFNHSCAIDD